MADHFRIGRGQIAIVDTVTGRRHGGHQADYLNVLEDALGDSLIETYAPFRNIDAKDEVPAKLIRLYAIIRGIRKLIGRREKLILIYHTPEFLDFVAFYAAAGFSRIHSKEKVAGLFVFRRDAAGIIGRSGWKAAVLVWIARRLAKSGLLFPVSDSSAALKMWERTLGISGQLVAIPVRPRPAESAAKKPEDPITFGLIGQFRPEKGTPHYGGIVGAALSTSPDAEIILQLPGNAPDATPPEAEILRASLAGQGRARLVAGYLPDNEYTRLLAEIDVLVLPYDVRSYGLGTSGVMFEILSMNGVVLTTRFEWAVSEFADHPNVFWMETLEDVEIKRGLRAAAEKVRELRARDSDDSRPGTIAFRASWLEAIQRAADRKNTRALT